MGNWFVDIYDHYQLLFVRKKHLVKKETLIFITTISAQIKRKHSIKSYELQTTMVISGHILSQTTIILRKKRAKNDHLLHGVLIKIVVVHGTSTLVAQ